MENDLIFATETADMLTGSGAEETQIAAVPSLGTPYQDALDRPLDAAQVVIPQGENIVRIPVAPGEVVELPFPSDAQFLARIDNGNLAIKVGDVTVILQGYVEAAGQATPTIVAADGQPLDIATILASTDPAIDIETAAGPAAGPQGQGADNTGGIFALFGPGGGLGGFTGVGALDATEGPGAGTIEPDGTEIRFDDELATLDIDTNVDPIFKAGLTGILNRSEDAANTQQTLNWVIVDPDDTKHTLSVDPATLPPGVSFNPATNQLSFNTKGHYDYLAPGEKETFIITFTIHDEHGGSVDQNFTLSMVGKADASDAVADKIFTNVGANSGFVIPEWALIANDKDASTEDVTAVGGDSGGASSHVAGVGTNGQVGFTDNATLSGSFQYTATDGSKATVTVNNQAGGDLSGTASNDILVGSGGAEKIEGQGGKDIIFGNGGADDIYGGGGDDTLIFSAGAKFHGGSDSLSPSGGLGTLSSQEGDILALAADLKLADSADAAGIDGIETISMQEKFNGIAGGQSLTIGAASVQQVSDHTLTPGGVFTSERDAVRIDGDAVDQLYLSISKDGGSWSDTGQVINGYHVYVHETIGGNPATADAYVMVSATIPAANVHLNADQP